MTNRPLRVFLCHSSNDKLAVRELYQKLRAEPWIDPWLDEEKLLPGQKWKREIPKAVRQADAVIICLSETSITKEGYVQREIKFALDFALEKPDGAIYLIPAKIKECEVPDSLSDWQWVNLFDPRGFDFILQSLKLRAKDLDLEVEVAVSKKEEMPAEQKELFVGVQRFITKEEKLVEDNKPVIEVQKPSFLAHPTAKWINTNKITFSNGVEFMRVPAGKFIMGEDEEPSLKSVNPKHIVDISHDYWIARFPVTNELYNVYVASENIKHPVEMWEQKKDHPVTEIRWEAVKAYCLWLNNFLKKEIPSGMVFRLPTEAEWEKSARGTDGRMYPWGSTFDAACYNVSGKRTTSVGLFSPQGDSPYGCADMAGNVWEWTHSLVMDYPYNANDGREDERVSGDHVKRGGSFGETLVGMRCSSRYIHFINYYQIIGFRICLAPPLF